MHWLLHDNGNGSGNGKQPEDFIPPLYASPDFQTTSIPTSSIHVSQSYYMPPKPGAQFVVLLANQLPEEKSGMSQEEFNAMMCNFMSTMGFAASKQGEQAATSWQPAFQFRQAGCHLQGVRASPVCYTCGNRGHYSDACTSPALSPSERQGIREVDRVKGKVRMLSLADSSMRLTLIQLSFHSKRGGQEYHLLRWDFLPWIVCHMTG